MACSSVDAVGGHLSFMRKLGYVVPDFDFTVPGVTSISADMHKYGYAAKGASVILYRTKAIRRYQIFACTDTTGYTLINPTMLSSKGGGALAGAWAILNYLGEEGYDEIVQAVQSATQKVVTGINAIPGLRVLGKPAMCMFSFASDEINVFQLADEMAKRGWYIQGQFSTLLTPRNLHISVSYGTLPNVDALLKDLEECTQIVRDNPAVDAAAIRNLVAVFVANPAPEAFARLAGMAGLVGTDLPGELAVINEMLDALPDALANEFLINFFNHLYV
jgi:glutamate/tyrosine decarboxylase-like PLP-dependent enzyme